jgi:dipeptidyl aminopeptidase/acylaminoacyl peptidase
MAARVALVLLLTAATLAAQVPANLVVEGVPSFPKELIEKLRPYMEARSATFQDWNPARPQMLISTRFADTPQLHLVKMPGGDRKQLTFFEDRVGGGRFRPGDPDTIFFSKDVGGGENFQFYRYDLRTGQAALITDGKSRHTAMNLSHDGRWMTFSSNRRNGKDSDIYLMDVNAPADAEIVLQNDGGGWAATDISLDGSKLLVVNFLSANESKLFLLDLKTGEKKLLTPKTASYSGAKFSRDGGSIYFTTDEGSEFHHLVRMPLNGGAWKTLNSEPWNVEDFELAPDGRHIAYVTNENGISVLHVIDATTKKALTLPQLPIALIGNLSWHPNGELLGLTLTSAKSPSDAYSIDLHRGLLTRWTESETGGLNTARNAEPQLVTLKSFDGLQISAFLYRPDPAKFPGRRPVLINIHGGPEGQSRPGFLGRNNYVVNELGIALLVPNVRGSTGYGKTFLAADNGMKREDSVKDIGALLDWIATDSMLDASRVGVTGGSYGGYMTLAAMTHYNDRFRAAIDVVGISNFLTFFQNTADYRKDLRRVEYGDERDPKMKEFFEKISPIANAAKITKPLFVIAGFNDPRVPWTEGEQMVKTVRANGAPVWWLMAKDEGHGFAKKRNQDFQYVATMMFLQKYLTE